MHVLVGYASAHGSTKGVAEEIGERLAVAGHDVDVRSIDEIETVGDAEAVVLGSAVHDRAWLPDATAFLEVHADALAERRVWLFSVGTIGDTGSFLHPWVAALLRPVRGVPRGIAGLGSTLHPRGHRTFAGAIERDHWTLPGDLFLKLCGGSYGDHRDWADIDAWADAIAAQLGDVPT